MSSSMSRCSSAIAASLILAGPASAAELPFQEKFTVVVPAGLGSSCASFAVPPGQRLVVEFVSARITLNVAQRIRALSLTTSVAGKTVRHAFQTTRQAPPAADGLTDHVAAQITRVYADPASVVQVCGERSENYSGAMTSNVAVSGVLIDTP